MNDATARSLVPGVVRTLVPVIYGLLIHAGLGQLGLPETFVTGLLASVLTAGLYAAIRLLEAKVPAFGWLLGLAKQPVYVKPETPVTAPAAPVPPADPVPPVS